METRISDGSSAETLDQLIRFAVDKEEYGVDIQKVKEVIKIKDITKLPKAPVFVKGVINLRGDIIPVIDLREKFGIEEKEYGDSTRIIVAEVDNRSIGMVVDSVSHVIRIAQDQIEPPPEMAGGLSREFLFKKHECPVLNLYRTGAVLFTKQILTTVEKNEKLKNWSKAGAGVFIGRDHIRRNCHLPDNNTGQACCTAGRGSGAR